MRSEKAQVITLMGAILSIAIIVMAAVSASLASLGTEVIMSRSTSLLAEFFNVKDTFAYALNKSIDDIWDDELIMEKIEEVDRDISILEAKHGRYFDAELLEIHDPITGYTVDIRYVRVRLTLTDGVTTISKDMEIPIYGTW